MAWYLVNPGRCPGRISHSVIRDIDAVGHVTLRPTIMIVHGNPAISRVPTEIWWHILEYTIYFGDFFACAFEGDDWARVAEDYSRAVTWEWEFEEAKEQIRVLSMVCRSWKEFIQVVASRFRTISDNFTEEPGVEAITLAHRVHVTTKSQIASSFVGKSVDWRVICTRQEHAEDLGRISHPNLRKLQIRYVSHTIRTFDGDKFVSSLAPFRNIIWFSYETAALDCEDCTEDDKGQKITLPNLRVLQYYGMGGFHFPFYRLDLPSLRHLSIQAKFDPASFPVYQPIVEAYGKTLESLYIKAPWGGFAVTSPNHPYFPRWENVPRLRELALDSPISLHFHPLPRTHPLRIFAGQIWIVEDLSSWLDSENLRVIRMLHGSRERDGRLVHSGKDTFHLHYIPDISSSEMQQLEEKAALKGIVLQSCSELGGRL
ncbi:hypothetical protein FRC15_004139 [Serendipita sp. 397]|nr:hypothetical protein FRC15_004139 [Serendipita sp. 397]